MHLWSGLRPRSPSAAALAPRLAAAALAAALAAAAPGLAAAYLLLTEIADPNDCADCRFLELYSASGAGSTVALDYTLTRWTNGNAAPTSSNDIVLHGATIGSDGGCLLAPPGSWPHSRPLG